MDEPVTQTATDLVLLGDAIAPLAWGMTALLLGVLLTGALKLAYDRPYHSPYASPTPTADDDVALRRADWSHAERMFNDVREALAEFEFDPYGWIRTPALRDVTVPQTAAFFDAFDRAQSLHTETVPHDPSRIADFSAAATKAQRAWTTAFEHAESLGTTQFSRKDRTKLRQAEAALAVALNEGASEAERLVALDTITRLVTGIVTIPQSVVDQTRTAIDTAHRKQLTR